MVGVSPSSEKSLQKDEEAFILCFVRYKITVFKFFLQTSHMSAKLPFPLQGNKDVFTFFLQFMFLLFNYSC